MIKEITPQLRWAVTRQALIDQITAIDAAIVPTTVHPPKWWTEMMMLLEFMKDQDAGLLAYQGPTEDEKHN